MNREAKTMTETVPQQTTMAAAFERALEQARPREKVPPSIEEQFATMYEENRRLRVENGELKSIVQAKETLIEELDRRVERSRQVRNSLTDELSKALEAVARYNRRRTYPQETRIYGFAYPGDEKPLPYHFGRSMRHAKHYAMTDEPEFRDTHDPELELVECLVRIRPNGARVRVLDFDRKPHGQEVES